jgi:hypothetical protein
VQLGTQFTGNVPANSARRWFTHSWNANWRVHWLVVPTGPVQDAAPQLEWKVQVERQTATLVKYYIEIRNVSPRDVTIEARYAIMNL